MNRLHSWKGRFQTCSHTCRGMCVGAAGRLAGIQAGGQAGRQAGQEQHRLINSKRRHAAGCRPPKTNRSGRCNAGTHHSSSSQYPASAHASQSLSASSHVVLTSQSGVVQVVDVPSHSWQDSGQFWAMYSGLQDRAGTAQAQPTLTAQAPHNQQHRQRRSAAPLLAAHPAGQAVQPAQQLLLSIVLTSCCTLPRLPSTRSTHSSQHSLPRKPRRRLCSWRTSSQSTPRTPPRQRRKNSPHHHRSSRRHRHSPRRRKCRSCMGSTHACSPGCRSQRGQNAAGCEWAGVGWGQAEGAAEGLLTPPSCKRPEAGPGTLQLPCGANTLPSLALAILSPPAQ